MLCIIMQRPHEVLQGSTWLWRGWKRATKGASLMEMVWVRGNCGSTLTSVPLPGMLPWEPYCSSHAVHHHATAACVAAGEYVAVERLEETYKGASLVEMVWVYGNSYESTLVAVVVPVEAALMAWAQKAGVHGSFANVCSSPKAAKHVLEALTAVALSGRLKASTSQLQ